ncbi:MAG: phosphoribosylformylglycinamidine cyclo-ligase [Candidatus Marinimicrobia bacterium]|nr:phosphoribosylformylglycinamidine cyclo-ligase [Candidatus Neomarinimicrobiota bacterium]|tara:strand:- start:1010 stop:2035 length:1026 start_codon:yes stop_codon:yes gene_type:complete
MKKTKNSYKKSGVNIETADKFTKFIGKITKVAFKKKNKFFAENIGGFASVYNFYKHNIKDPLLVSSTDGVGTKLELANRFNKFDSIGIDLVAMCVNDLIVQGAKPLIFLDYISVQKINLKKLKLIVKGIVKGCKISDCSLVGGETAEMPGTYSKNKFDLAGFVVGVVSRKKLLNKNNVKNKDIILAIPSSGLHSNGFSLVRHILKKQKISSFFKNELLKPTKIYVREILKLSEKKLIHASANITGGGIIGNINRSVPDNLTVNIDLSKIKVKKIFKWIKSKNISDAEMLKTFNCGVGFCLIADKKNIKKIKKTFGANYKPYEIGYISKASKRLKLFKSIKW